MRVRSRRRGAAPPRAGGPFTTCEGAPADRRPRGGGEGKGVTTITGVPVSDDELKALAGRLKKRCGVGGSAKDGVIELQGDHRDTVVEVLRKEGYDVVLAGG